MFTLPEGQHLFTDILVIDDPGDGGAYHEYRVVRRQPEPVGQESTAPVFSTVSFQKGPVAESGVNGVFMEDLLEICRHRLQCFQAGNFVCRENALALTKIEEALHWLNHRTADRQRRKVEGTSQK